MLTTFSFLLSALLDIINSACVQRSLSLAKLVQGADTINWSALLLRAAAAKLADLKSVSLVHTRASSFSNGSSSSSE